MGGAASGGRGAEKQQLSPRCSAIGLQPDPRIVKPLLPRQRFNCLRMKFAAAGDHNALGIRRNVTQPV